MADMTDEDSYRNLPLGREVDYPQHYDASVLCPIPRQLSRDTLGIAARQLPFVGEDIWNAYELSWLDMKGKPVVAQAEFRVPADSPAIIESKSFKLYLNSFNQSRFQDQQAVAERLTQDLSAVARGDVRVSLSTVDSGPVATLSGFCVDELDVSVDDYSLCPQQLKTQGPAVEEQLYSHLLRSLCPVTGQPDWATLVIHYRGPQIDREGLLRYVIGYRQHQEFHEQCVERIYCDISHYCQPEFLLVYARYLRRGGLDINPYRCSEARQFDNLRLGRQ